LGKKNRTDEVRNLAKQGGGKKSIDIKKEGEVFKAGKTNL